MLPASVKDVSEVGLEPSTCEQPASWLPGTAFCAMMDVMTARLSEEAVTVLWDVDVKVRERQSKVGWE